MTNLKDISYLFFSKKEQESSQVISSIDKSGKSFYTILIASFSNQFTSINFGTNIAKELSKKDLTVFLLNLEHILLNYPLISQYVNNEANGRSEIRVESIMDKYESEKGIDNIYKSFSNNNFLLINYPKIAEHDLSEDYLRIINDLILIITPDTDSQLVCSLLSHILRLNNDINIKIGISEAESCLQAESIYRDVVFRLRGKVNKEINLIGFLPSSVQPYQVVLGDRIFNLARPGTVKTIEANFQKISENLLSSIKYEENNKKTYNVFSSLQKILTKNANKPEVSVPKSPWPFDRIAVQNRYS